MQRYTALRAMFRSGARLGLKVEADIGAKRTSQALLATTSMGRALPRPIAFGAARRMLSAAPTPKGLRPATATALAAMSRNH